MSAADRSNRYDRSQDRAADDASLTVRAETAAQAELRGERGGILGAIDASTLAPLPRTRRVPERWTFYWVLSHFQ